MRSTPRPHPAAPLHVVALRNNYAQSAPTPSPHAVANTIPDTASDPAPDAAVLPPAVPVLPSTLLGLELLLQRNALDLHATRELLCEDPGALLHLFAMVSAEYPDPTSQPARLEDCIASLSAERLLRTCAQAGSARREQAAFASFARHGATIGRYAQVVAESLGLGREQALLIGTLHELGSLPFVLGWSTPFAPEREAIRRCDDLARRYHLPHDLRTALDAVHRDLSGSVWVAVLAAAHDLLGTT